MMLLLLSLDYRKMKLAEKGLTQGHTYGDR